LLFVDHFGRVETSAVIIDKSSEETQKNLVVGIAEWGYHARFVKNESQVLMNFMAKHTVGPCGG
jgi:hypothetical protein